MKTSNWNLRRVIAGDRAAVGGGTAPNKPPTITQLGNQTANLGNVTLANLTVGDDSTPPGSLSLSATSSNITIVPTACIAFGGSGANRTVSITPQAFGNTTITITVTDSGNLTNSTTFNFFANALPPTILNLIDFRTTNGCTTTIGFNVTDPFYTSGFTVSAVSANLTVLPAANISPSMSGMNGTIGMETGNSGTSTVNVTVRNAANVACSTTFNVVGSVNLGNDCYLMAPYSDQMTDVYNRQYNPVGILNTTIAPAPCRQGVQGINQDYAMSSLSSNGPFVSSTINLGSGNTSFTIALRANITGTISSNDTLINWTGNTTAALKITWTTANKILVTEKSTGDTGLTGNGTHAAKTPIDIIVTANSTTTVLYVNGINEGSRTRVGNMPNSSFNVPSASTATTIQDWGVWRHVFSAAEIASYHQQQSPKYDFSATNNNDGTYTFKNTSFPANVSIAQWEKSPDNVNWSNFTSWANNTATVSGNTVVESIGNGTWAIRATFSGGVKGSFIVPKYDYLTNIAAGAPSQAATPTAIERGGTNISGTGCIGVTYTVPSGATDVNAFISSGVSTNNSHSVVLGIGTSGNVTPLPFSIPNNWQNCTIAIEGVNACGTGLRSSFSLPVNSQGTTAFISQTGSAIGTTLLSLGIGTTVTNSRWASRAWNSDQGTGIFDNPTGNTPVVTLPTTDGTYSLWRDEINTYGQAVCRATLSYVISGGVLASGTITNWDGTTSALS